MKPESEPIRRQSRRRVCQGRSSWIRILTTGLAVLFLCTTPWTWTAAQDLFLVRKRTPLSTPSQVLLVNKSGQITSVAATFPAGWHPTWAAVDEDNHDFVITAWYNTPQPSTPGGAVFRLTGNGSLRTLNSSTVLKNPEGIVLGERGSWILFDKDVQQGSLNCYRISRMNQITSLGQLKNMSFVSAGMDHDSGHPILVALDLNQRMVHYLRIDPVHGTPTTFALVENNLSNTTQPLYEPATGSMVIAGQPRSGNVLDLYRISPENGLSTIAHHKNLTGTPTAMNRLGGRAHPGIYSLLIRNSSSTMNMVTLDRSGIVLSTSRVSPSNDIETDFMVRKRSRHLVRRPAGTGKYQLRVDYPDERGRPYVVPLSLLGARYGIPLPDGRTVPIANDHFLFYLSLLGQFGKIFTGTVGNLDSRGQAFVRLDVTGLNLPASGLRVTAVALVLDPLARSGVAEISLPVGLPIP